jgi:hypothetical protein
MQDRELDETPRRFMAHDDCAVPVDRHTLGPTYPAVIGNSQLLGSKNEWPSSSAEMAPPEYAVTNQFEIPRLPLFR